MRDKELEKMKGKCHFCKKEVDGWDYCYGCKHFVCLECGEAVTFGLHNVEDHKEL
jgi:Fe2+ or Zn2+ uptake regulation protein